MINSRFDSADRTTADVPDFAFKIDEACLGFAEHGAQPIIQENSLALSLWRRAFGANMIPTFIKKSLATTSWDPSRNYLLLNRMTEAGGSPVRLVVLDNPLNQLLVPYLEKQFPSPSVQVRGIGKRPWRAIQNAPVLLISTLELWARLIWRISKGGITVRSDRKPFRICKEIVWGIGTGRRTDDFMVDGDLIRPEDVLFYTRRTSSSRMGPRPGILQESLYQAKKKGYTCVGYDDSPITVSLLINGFLYRYLIFPIVLSCISLAKQIFNSPSGLLHSMVMLFLIRTMRWEVFLATYAPSLHLGQGEPHPGHIADTVGLNLHGCQSGGFQWADMTQWRSVQSAYVGLNVYFAWGVMQEKFWEGNWNVDRIVHSGYPWGHFYQESLQGRGTSKTALLGPKSENSFVVALFDEAPSPNWILSDKVISDFYNIGVRLLEKRSDIIVVAKPKRFDGIKGFPNVSELIDSYIESGRFQIWDKGTVDLWETLAVCDVAVSIGAPFLEAVSCNMSGFNFGPWNGNYSSDIYDRGQQKVTFNDVDELVSAIESVLDHPESDPWAGLEDLLDEADPYRDFRGIDRMRKHIHHMTGVGSPL